MKVTHRLQAFRRSEAGAVTVDWVVLTAVLVTMAMLMLSTLGEGLNTTTATMNANMIGE